MTRFATLCALSLLVSSSAVAQGKADAPARAVRDKEAVQFDEIERGFHFGLSFGGWFILNPPALPGGRQPFSPGQMTQFELGMDFGERVAVDLFLAATANRAGSDYVGKSNPVGAASGDFFSLIPGASARVRAVGFNDSQDVKRTWIYGRIGGGYALFAPKALLPDGDVLIFVGPGVEYYTRLRHFSIGLEVLGTFLASNGSIGIAATPNLRYAF